MKITVFNGSPRGRKSNSHEIVKPLLEGAAKSGAETKEIFLIEKDIRYCRGCFDCWGKTPGTCVIKDDMEEMLNIYLDSDYVGLATPVYGMLMTGLMKNFTDRFLPLATPHIRRDEQGNFYHDGRMRKLPRQFLIANAGFPGEHNFDMLKTYYAQQNFVLEIYRNCGEVLREQLEESSEVQQRINQFRNALREAGRELVANGVVSGETVEKIHLPLISDEEYMNAANRAWDEEIAKAEKDE